MPGAAPLGATMQGNPNGASSAIPVQDLSGNQNTSAQLLATQISNGNISANSVPTNVNSAPGHRRSPARAYRARGQGDADGYDSTRQSAFIPANGGASNQNIAAATPVVTRVASGLVYPAPGAQNHTGN